MAKANSRRRAKARLIVTVSDMRGRRATAGGLGRWLMRVAPRQARGTVSIALISDVEMRRLNATYRQKDSSTDVLSFPAQVRRADRTAVRQRPQELGDVAIATSVARRQAREYGHSFETELRILALHGLLHLLGYDHESDRGEMRRVEDQLRRKGGLTHGLITRVPGAPR